MVNRTVESKLSSEQRHELAELRKQLKATNTRIAELNQQRTATERELEAARKEARRLAFNVDETLKHQKKGDEDG